MTDEKSPVKKPGSLSRLRIWLWVAIGVILVVVITVPIVQLINLPVGAKSPADNHTASVTTTGFPAAPSEAQSTSPAASSSLAPPGAAPAGTSLPLEDSETAPGAIEPETTPTETLLSSDYVTFDLQPSTIDKLEVIGDGTFTVRIAADAAVVQAIPFNISNANLSLEIYATDMYGTASVPLTITANNAVYNLPTQLNETFPFTDYATLAFPEGAEDSRYLVIMKVNALSVGTDYGMFDIQFDQLSKDIVLGTIYFSQLYPQVRQYFTGVVEETVNGRHLQATITVLALSDSGVYQPVYSMVAKKDGTYFTDSIPYRGPFKIYAELTGYNRMWYYLTTSEAGSKELTFPHGTEVLTANFYLTRR